MILSRYHGHTVLILLALSRQSKSLGVWSLRYLLRCFPQYCSNGHPVFMEVGYEIGVGTSRAYATEHQWHREKASSRLDWKLGTRGPLVMSLADHMFWPTWSCSSPASTSHRVFLIQTSLLFCRTVLSLATIEQFSSRRNPFEKHYRARPYAMSNRALPAIGILAAG